MELSTSGIVRRMKEKPTAGRQSQRKRDEMSKGTSAGERQVTNQAGLATQLEQALEAGELVVVCWEPGCTMHRLPHWDEHQWISHERRQGYRHYSHGICHWHYEACRADIERFVAECEAVHRGRGAVLTAT